MDGLAFVCVVGILGVVAIVAIAYGQGFKAKASKKQLELTVESKPHQDSTIQQTKEIAETKAQV